ncbi:MAG: M20/M25/M40 family metallo-hydrolase, partial [Anaerolineales bacterium]|nr:M20/M25/M40 family metallo-hydrolase [Anaerolineales bacterium]
MPTIGTAQIKLLEKLCNAMAVSGDEGEVRTIVLEAVRPYADEVKVDALGNVLVIRHGAELRADPEPASPREGVEGEARSRSAGKDRLRVMLAAHMDEVGFMLAADEGEGIFRFETVGSMDIRQLPGKAVIVGKEHLPGVIGVRPIHLVKDDELKNKISLESLRIDLGPGGAKAKPGDRATFAAHFQRSGPSIIARALDNRLGVATLIELVRHAPPNVDLLAAFTVQEEIGTRGAKVAAYAFDPDLAIAIDSTPANDLPAWDASENVAYNTKLGLGPAIYVTDKGTLSDPRLIRHLVATAETKRIPYQLRQPGGGGTDAGAIHKGRAGIPSVSVSVPGRYMHTAASLARLDDWKNTLALLHAALS